MQCAPTTRVTSGGRFHPESCRFVGGHRHHQVLDACDVVHHRVAVAVRARVAAAMRQVKSP